MSLDVPIPFESAFVLIMDIGNNQFAEVIIDAFMAEVVKNLGARVRPLTLKDPIRQTPVVRKRDPRNGRSATVRFINIVHALRPFDTEVAVTLVRNEYDKVIDLCRRVKPQNHPTNDNPLDCRISNWPSVQIVLIQKSIQPITHILDDTVVGGLYGSEETTVGESISSLGGPMSSVDMDIARFKRERAAQLAGQSSDPFGYGTVANILGCKARDLQMSPPPEELEPPIGTEGAEGSPSTDAPQTLLGSEVPPDALDSSVPPPPHEV